MSHLVTLPQDTLSRIDDAISRFAQTLKSLRQIPKQGEDGVRVDGIEHELVLALAKRLQSLRDDVAGGESGKTRR
jgi:hypothetical protein